MTKIFAHIDCNNFYVSCQRIFQPELRGRPVVVLSNNDGCIISRSNEAKALGIKMGVPYHEALSIIRKHNITVFSSNYALYADVSNRVMSILSMFCPDLEVYSIDEAFMELTSLKNVEDYLKYGRFVRETIFQYTAIPVSIGISTTKTLAKVATKIAKKNQEHNNVFLLTDEIDIQLTLQQFPVEDIWGIGFRYSQMLKKHQITTAYELTTAPLGWIQRQMTVNGSRLYHELRGKSCITLNHIVDKRNICTSRSLAKHTDNFEILTEWVSTFAASCAKKLRKQKSCATVIIVFIHTDYFKKDMPQYSKSVVVNLPESSNSSFEIIKYACLALKKIYKKGYLYKKVGVIVSEICPENQVNYTLFSDEKKRKKEKTLMFILDNMNKKYGRDILKVSSQKMNPKDGINTNFLSPRYTTCFDEIVKI